MRKRILSALATTVAMAMVIGVTVFAGNSPKPSPTTPTGGSTTGSTTTTTTETTTTTTTTTTKPATTTTTTTKAPETVKAPAIEISAAELAAPEFATTAEEAVAMSTGVSAASDDGKKVTLAPTAPTVVSSAKAAAKKIGGTPLKVMDIKIENAQGGKVTVAGVGTPGMKLTVLHFNGKSWDNYGTYTVAANGTLSFNAPSLSPIAFVAADKTAVSPKTGEE